MPSLRAGERQQRSLRSTTSSIRLEDVHHIEAVEIGIEVRLNRQDLATSARSGDAFSVSGVNAQGAAGQPSRAAPRSAHGQVAGFHG